MNYFFQCICLIFLFISCADNNQVSQVKEQSTLTDTVKQTDSLEWKVYGLPDNKDVQRYHLAKKWGFKYQVVAGCIVSDSLVEAVRKNNKRSDSLFTISFGKDWQRKFESGADSLFKLDSISRIHK